MLLLISPSSEPRIVWTMTKRMWFCLISYLSTDLFLFLSFYLAPLPSFSWSVNWSAVFGKTMLRHLNPLPCFSFSLCCPFICIWEWNRTDNWRFPLSAMSQSSSFLILVPIRPSYLDFYPTGTRTQTSWYVCSCHTNMENRCRWSVGVWKQLWNPQFRCNEVL